MRLAAAIWLAALPVAAEPRFAAVPDALPAPHIYGGGWEHFVGGGVAVFDCNGDALPDLYIAGGESPARLYVNRSDGGAIRFAEAPAEALTGVTGAYPLDIDSDGHLDLAILRVGANALWRGRGACAFEEAGDAWGFEAGARWSTAFSATWEGAALWPTLAIGNYVDRANPDGPFQACDANELHRPGPAGYGAPLPLAPGYCALSMLVSDWQRRGTPELRISNDRHYYVRGGQEEMWRLDPLAARTEADGWPRISLWGMGIASADITGNGLPDVMLTSMGDQLLKLNTGAGYDNAPFAIGTYAQRPHIGDDGRPATGWHAEFGDIDNDGRLDLFIAKGNVDQMPSNAMEDPNNLLMQRPDGSFTERSVEAGLASTRRGRGAALADLDGDGRLDVVVVNRRAPVEIWRNETEAGNWLGVDLRQSAPNTRAVGAWIEVETDAGVQAREVTVGGGHAGGQAGPVHFGLGAAEAARVRVIWPGGTAGAWIEVPVNETIGIQRLD
ncbi:MAG: CRTAC1 family protein [Paracoccaceae bacterium]|nr:CRTAC1 family protein [Paracoccaceae bacterium]